MLPQDRQLILKLRKRISILIIIIFSLCYWIRINYYDLDWKKFELDDLRQESIEKDKKISTLQEEIDSIKNTKQKEAPIKKAKKIINTKNKETQSKTDTAKVTETEIPKIESVIPPADSTKN